MDKNKNKKMAASNDFTSDLPAFCMGLLYFILIASLAFYVIVAE